MLHRQKHGLHSSAGFTLIEMLVVIVMVGIVAAIAAPSWQGFLDRQRMNAVRSDLIGVLRTAQDEAQARQKSRQVTFLTDTASTSSSVMVGNVSAIPSGLTTVLGNGETGNKFNLLASTPIIFDHDGRVNVTTPYVIKIINSEAPSSSSPTQSCVIVTTLLGGLKPANDNLCDTF